ncbi:MAG: hypothetical protein H7A23_04150 [Leptospiraceae bacterium]|nr:hypothetical protein [Leptospiraceae bacterium]MCP5493724.1 hypothetical protein [Leptospiraceae bacterium]
MKTRLNLVALTIAIIVSLVACGGGSKKADKKKPAQKTEGATASQKVMADRNGELRVVESPSAARTVREVVVGPDGKLQVVEREIKNTLNSQCMAPMPTMMTNQMCAPTNPCVTSQANACVAPQPMNACVAPQPANLCVAPVTNPCAATPIKK